MTATTRASWLPKWTKTEPCATPASFATTAAVVEARIPSRANTRDAASSIRRRVLSFCSSLFRVGGESLLY